ncbi:uncharacterized protein N7487_002483 [Penicillium crustosum]|uniref:uncharacterized protein n=1 Tax=Penicillium crustosum TaxID=36656 RepID=UPI002386345F|nr:uncharacterized protein N7487_002483 [Penicillium crustosum]KAJ5418933.1 hypothetical protein N7487_002483 [Penicillium crustosum]
MAEELHILESAQAEVRYGLAKATSLLRQARTPESEALRGSIRRETEVIINDFRKVGAALSTSSDGHTGRTEKRNAKSRLLQISDKAVLETRLEELDMIRKAQIQTNEYFERKAKEAS